VAKFLVTESPEAQFHVTEFPAIEFREAGFPVDETETFRFPVDETETFRFHFDYRVTAGCACPYNHQYYPLYFWGTPHQGDHHPNTCNRVLVSLQ